MASARLQVRPTRTRSISAIELSIFNNNDNTEAISLRPTAHPDPWHPKLTLYRLLILVATVGLGAAKAVTSYLNLNYASITLEWIMGVVVFIFLHLLGSYAEDDEVHNTRPLKWLFDVDYFECLWSLLTIFDIERPIYRSDELMDPHDLPRRPPITGYRIMVTILVLFFGILKSSFWYGNHQKEVTTIECVFGIGIATCLYWIGLYEDSSTKVYPLLFHVDFTATLLNGASTGVILGVVIGKMCLCLVALMACSAVTVAFYYLTTLMFNFHWHGAFFPEYPIVSVSTGLIAIFFLGLASCSGFVFGLGSLFFFLALLLIQLPDILMPRRMQRAMFFLGSFYENYWETTTPRQQRSRFFYLKRLLFRQSKKLPMNILTTITLIFSVFFLFWLALMFAYVPALMLESYVPTTLTFPILCFFSVPFSIFLSFLFVRDFYRGFLNFLSDIRNDYTHEGPVLH